MGTLIVKAIKFVNLCRLMISSKQEEVLRVLDLIAKKENNSLDGLFASIHIVPQK